MSDTYKVRVRCTNCGKVQEVEIEKGERVANAECPNCGCGNCLERIPGGKVFK